MSALMVRGVVDDSFYEVQVTGRADEPVVGNRRVAALVRQWQGQSIAVTPTGPVVLVDGADPRSVLALLEVETDVRYRSSVPRGGQPVRAGVVR